jgi:hypothetical protein
MVRQFSIGVPPGWSIRELEDKLEIQSEAEDVAVIVTSFSGGSEPIDVVAQIQMFLDSAQTKNKGEIRRISGSKASVEYTDVDDAKWYVAVITEERRFLLVTCNTGDDCGRKNFPIGKKIVESIELYVAVSQ